MKNEALLLEGDCLEVLKELPDNSVDSLVTDPPAGISFMGKAWDEDKGGSKQWIAWMEQVMVEAKRVMKPGAHGLVWAIPRTSHWTATALENAGFEIRDVVTHLFGSGFPKSHNISKSIDSMLGVEPKVLGISPNDRPKSQVKGGRAFDRGLDEGQAHEPLMLTEPGSVEAKQWAGFGTALKPAHEMWWLVRKPLGERTVAANVLKHGTGGLNIDASRIGNDSLTYESRLTANSNMNDDGWGKIGAKGPVKSVTGRFPANLVLSHNEDCIEVGTKKVKSGDPHRFSKAYSMGEGHEGWKRPAHENYTPPIVTTGNQDGTETASVFECSPGCAVAELDRQSGILKSAGEYKDLEHASNTTGSGAGMFAGGRKENNYANQAGGASRFFYCAKASKRDKGDSNVHPTVKSTKLMSYLITMVTPPGGIVLDPFLGSGTTGVSAIRDGFSFIGIEKEPEYLAIAEKRIDNAKGAVNEDRTIDDSEDDTAA